jgi:dihydroorotate dehydrogenase electron transfer subunit
MKLLTSNVVSVGERITGLVRPSGRSIKFSQTITLNCPDIAGVSKPGQFVMVNCGQDCTLPRPFSIHQVFNKEKIMLYFAVLEGGKGTNWLSQRKVGDKIKVFGPLGKGFSIEAKSKNLLLIAGGMGVATLYYLATETLNKVNSVNLLYGTAISNPYPGTNLPPGINLITITEDGTSGKKGRVTDFLPEYIEQADQIFACGPLPMLKYMSENKKKLGLAGKPVQISLEMRMGCGVGVCYGCTIRTKSGLKQVCKDGPVFDLDEVIWDELIKI